MKRLGLLLVMTLALAGCTEAPSTTTTKLVRTPVNCSQELTIDPSEGRQFNLTTAEVKSITVPEKLTLNGQIEPDETLTTPVISLMPGRIERAAALLGATVKKGQILAEVRSDEVAQVESDLLRDTLSLDADIAETKVDLDLAKAVFDRKNALLKEGIAAKADVEQAKRDLDHSTAMLTSLQTKKQAIITSAGERLRLFGVHEEELERLLDTKRIDNTFDVRSPRSGVISDRNADAGQLIDNVHSLFVVSDLSKVWLMADVYEKDIEKINVGDPATVQIDSFPNKTFLGKVDYMATEVTPETRTLKVRIIVDNPQMLLHPKMFARVTLEIGQKNIVAVPSESIQKTGETYVAYVRTGDNKYIERKVDIGKSYGNFTEVLSGLHKGETVVAHGSLELQGEMLQRLSQ